MERGMHALKFVLDFEAKGVETYLKLAQSSSDLLGKKLFYSLAAEEVQHARKADEFYGGISEKGVFMPAGTAPIEIQMKDFFEKMGKAQNKKNLSNIQGYTLAMELEKKGYAAYSGFLKAAKTEEERAFYKWILGEEKEHLDAVANVYSYYTGTGDWLQENESRTWNWMNL